MFIAVMILSPFAWCLTIARTSFERVYRSEQDARTRERMLLVLNVACHGMVAAHVARDLHSARLGPQTG